VSSEELSAAMGMPEDFEYEEVLQFFEEASEGRGLVTFPEATRIGIVGQMVEEEVVSLEELWVLWGRVGPAALEGFCEFFNQADELYEEKLTSNALTFRTKEEMARSGAEVGRLFQEGWDEQGLLPFEGLLKISEVADLIDEGELAKAELENVWALLPKGDGDCIDIATFRDLLAQIDDLFEYEDEANDAASDELLADAVDIRAGPQERFTVAPTIIVPGVRKAVKQALANGTLELVLTDGDVHPTKYIAGFRNPLSELGECGNCPLSRLIDGRENLRTEGRENLRAGFRELAVQEIKERFEGAARSEGLIYCTLACGFLYFDWELLNRLQYDEGVRIREVWVIEVLDRPGMADQPRMRRALSAFAGWFNGEVNVLAFPSLPLFEEFIVGIPEEERAHVLMRCDAASVGDQRIEKFKALAPRPGASDLELSPDTGGLRAVSRLERRPRGIEWNQKMNQVWFERKWTDVGEPFYKVLDKVPKAAP